MASSGEQTCDGRLTARAEAGKTLVRARRQRPGGNKPEARWSAALDDEQVCKPAAYRQWFFRRGPISYLATPNTACSFRRTSTPNPDLWFLPLYLIVHATMMLPAVGEVSGFGAWHHALAALIRVIGISMVLPSRLICNFNPKIASLPFRGLIRLRILVLG
jgi:hypothetical protein